MISEIDNLPPLTKNSGTLKGSYSTRGIKSESTSSSKVLRTNKLLMDIREVQNVQHFERDVKIQHFLGNIGGHNDAAPIS